MIFFLLFTIIKYNSLYFEYIIYLNEEEEKMKMNATNHKKNKIKFIIIKKIFEIF